jgi:hypothetical protein
VAGQETAAAPGSAHDWWNAGEEEAQVLVEFLPQSPRFELMISNMFGLALSRELSRVLPSPGSYGARPGRAGDRRAGATGQSPC